MNERKVHRCIMIMCPVSRRHGGMIQKYSGCFFALNKKLLLLLLMAEIPNIESSTPGTSIFFARAIQEEGVADLR